jgi:hypothetical protein
MLFAEETAQGRGRRDILPSQTVVGAQVIAPLVEFETEAKRVCKATMASRASGALAASAAVADSVAADSAVVDLAAEAGSMVAAEAGGKHDRKNI